MATRSKEIFLKGKVKWAHTIRPNKYDKWSVVLYPDAESLEIIRDLKETKPQILNVLSKDEDGYNMTFSRPQSKTYKGKVVGFAPPEVLDPTGRPITETLIGNGSDVTIKLEVFGFKTPGGGEGKAVRLKAIRVDNLIPYELQRDATPDQQELVAGVLEQPAPLF